MNNLQRIVSAGGKDITSSSPLLVNLLQSDVAAGHFNNLPQHRSQFSFEPAGPAVKRKRRPRKSKDGSPKVPKIGDGDEASIPLPGTFPGIGSQPQLENRVPPMGMEAAMYNVPNSLANSTGSETRASVTQPSGAQVHTPPLVERSHGIQGGPLLNQVSPNSSGTLSVSTPSPVRTTPERSLGSSGMQQMINPYTGQLEPVENSPSERTPIKSETSGDNTALDVPSQLQPPPNPLVALESRLAAGSQNLPIPSQLPSSPRTIDSPVNRSVPNTAQITTAAGTMVSSPHKTTMPPVSIPLSDSMQSKMTLPVSIPSVPHHVRTGNTLVSTPATLHNGPEFQPSFTSSARRSMAPSSALPSTGTNVVRHQGPTDIHAISRHPHVHQHGHPAHRLPGVSHNGPGNIPATISSELRHLPVGMGHPELRLRMPQHHQAGAIPHMAGEHGLPGYPNMPRSQGPAISGVAPLPMHSGEPSVATSGGVLTGHPRMPHPLHQQHPMPPGYYQHMRQHHARLPITNTVSAAHMMTSNPPPRLSHTPPGTSNSVIASQLMRPTLAVGSSLGMSVPTVTSVGSAQMTHPAIASQLSQNSSSPTKVPLPKVDSKAPLNNSLPIGSVTDDYTKPPVAVNVTEKEQQPRTIPANEKDSSKDKESIEKPPVSPTVTTVDNDSKHSASKSHPCPDESESSILSSVNDVISGSKAATNVTVSKSEEISPLPKLPQGDKPVIAAEKNVDSVQVSSQLTNSTNSDVTATSTTVIERNTEQSFGATGSDEKPDKVIVNEEQAKTFSDTEQDLKPGKNSASHKELSEEMLHSGAPKEEGQGNSSPLLELGTSVPSCSQDSDSPPTTSSPGDSDGTPALENCHESKLSDVSKLQPSPPQVRTTLSAIAMHNDLHSLVRGSNGASTGEASPVSDNLSSTSQQNYGQSPLGNSVGLHMNHDSELSSQSFDDNSSTPPHAPVVVGPTLSTTIIRENHSEGATKSKDNSYSSSKESLPKDQPAATVPETKNIITIGYAVSQEPVLSKEFADGRLNPSIRTLDDIPYLKKPSDDLNEENVSLKGVSLSEDFLNKKHTETQNMEGNVKRCLEENSSTESLNYRGQVPLFSRTMETCDLNPGGLSSPKQSENKFPVNGDIIETETDSSKIAILLDHSGSKACSEQSAVLLSKCSSSSSSRNSEDTEVPGELVEIQVPSEIEKKTLPVEDIGEEVVDTGELVNEEKIVKGGRDDGSDGGDETTCVEEAQSTLHHQQGDIAGENL